MPDDVDEQPAAPAPPPAVPAATGLVRTSKFRRGLLAKLPPLEYRESNLKDDFDLDDEWAAGGGVKADAIAGPLEPLAPDYLK